MNMYIHMPKPIAFDILLLLVIVVVISTIITNHKNRGMMTALRYSPP